MNTGMLYIIVILLIIFGIAYIATGPTPTQSGVQTGTEVVVNDAKTEQAKDRLQLYTFGGATITPPMSASCAPGGINARPDIIAYVSPKNATSVSSDSSIRIWVNDTLPLKIAPGEVVTRNSGSIVRAGDRTAKAPDGQLFAPALYIFPQTAEAGGAPFFPSNIRGDYDNGERRIAFGVERLPADITLKYGYTAQYTWFIKDLPIRSGSYQIQIVVTDSVDKHGVACFNMRVYDKPDPRWVIPD